MDKLLQELKGKVDQAEVYRLTRRTVPVNFRSGKLESIKSHTIDGIALRVIADGRLGFATTTNLADHRELIAAAIASAAFGETVNFSFTGPTPPVQVDVHDKNVANMPEEDLIDLGTRIIAEIRGADAEVDINLSVEKAEETVQVLNTAGLELTETRTTLGLGVEGSKAKPGDIFLLFDSASTRYAGDLNPEALTARIIHYLHDGARIVSVPSKPMPVVFTHNGAIAILLPLLVGFNGKSVYMGTSPLKDRLGDQVFDSQVTITDDGTIPRGPHSSGFDDEGTPSSRTPLAVSGVVKGFVYDRRTAALAGADPTGNGYKGSLFGGGFRTPPTVGMSNVIVSPGDTPEAELIAGIDEGLLVESVLGLGQGNIASGEFSNNVAVAFKIESGKIVGRVKNTMIAGNAYRLLKDHLIGIGKEARWTHGAILTPMIAVDQVNVVGG